ncbi:Tetratricopeptide repeat-containing protein [Fodinibius roseus]|uniref:Tetratricopeptide repeat-containing protein n=1 Tax=Fodinibius roseus TaxID=1194090 RepID=A0A1M5F241_9BACT|nr:FG-GAP-like repeat-containing protein [Fodinibius roseus]SHF85535.1 Tetratricopeptide repeat-containing protein [Fodinibius roseus]
MSEINEVKLVFNFRTMVTDCKTERISAWLLRVTGVILIAIIYSCTPEPSKSDIETDSEKYREAVADFYTSIAAIQSNQALFAVDKMQEVSERYPEEPAVWGNLSVFAMRQGNFELATTRIQKAIDLAPDHAEIQFLAGILESRKGNIQRALEHLKKAAETDSSDLRVQFALVDELERQDPDGNAKEIRERLDQILAKDPGNLALLLEVVRTSAKWNDQRAVEEALERLGEQSRDWPDQVRKQFREQKAAILDKEGDENITFELAFLRNNLNQLPGYQRDLDKVQLPANQVGFLIDRFLWLPNPTHQAAPRDEQLSFSAEDRSSGKVSNLFKPVGFADEKTASTIMANPGKAVVNDSISLVFPGRQNAEPSSPHGVTTVDYNYDFLNDLALAGTAGLRFYELQHDSTFTDVTDELNLSDEVLNESYYGVWTSDIDLDGDLDLVLAPHEGSVQVLRNNGDNSFEVRSYFDETENVRNFLWADFDQDGDPDAVLLTEEGAIHYYRNERSGEFQRDDRLRMDQPVYAVDYGDLNGDGYFELVGWQEGQISSTSFADSTGGWQHRRLLALTDTIRSEDLNAQLYIADLDNNGALDVMISGGDTTSYWLSDEHMNIAGSARRTEHIQLHGIADMDGDARLDMFGVNSEGIPVVLGNSGSKGYHARVLRPRASGELGDQRINSFGIGGEIESRSGLQYSKQAIRDPWVHLGLGTYEEAAMVRITWPNGSTQAEFAELGYESKIMNEQILKGSCPWIFAYNGEEMEFVTDFLWRTALGLRINAQGKANVIHSVDWVKLDGDQLLPRNGYYDVRITADLWETHFFDHVSLMAVDHPEDIEVFVDERFALPAPEQELYAMSRVRPVRSAKDFRRNEVTGAVREQDGEYVDALPLTAYQGLAGEHYIEVELDSGFSEPGTEWLIASGWIYPTDSSVNIAISQSDKTPPHGIRVEVPDGAGGWKVARENIGFPAGKNKTMVINLEGIFEPNTERKVRLYTNMEIYWDQLQHGLQASGMNLETTELAAETSELRHRGFSRLVNKERFKPTRGDYQQVTGTTPKWRDLTGYYTRFGDVRELTNEFDDRYVIMNAGDELVFRFPALEPPGEGWERDFVLVGDGWVKDGDYNTGHSKTVLPLPYHGMEDYSRDPGFLWEDPVYKKHKQDWAEYHTRYVTAENFNTALQFTK